MYNLDIGKKIQNIRKENNITQNELAEKLQVSRQAVSRWEANLSEPSIEAILMISKLFNLSVDELLETESKQASTKSKKSSRKKKISKNNINLLDNLKIISIVFIVILILIILASLTFFIIKNLFV